MTIDDLPGLIPIFPLNNILLLPNGLLPLNIFEERYLKMIDDTMKKDRVIGIIQSDTNQLAKTGCIGRIIQFGETDDDRYVTLLRGVIRFHIAEEVKSITPYRMVRADYSDFVDDMVEDCDTIELNRDAFLPLVKTYLESFGIEIDAPMIEDTPCQTLLTSLPMVCPFTAQEKQLLLEAETLEKRYKILTTLFEMAIQSKGDTTTMKH